MNSVISVVNKHSSNKKPRPRGILAGLLAAALVAVAHPGEIHAGAEPLTLRLDFAQAGERLRPLHGVNKGPLAAGGLLDVMEQHRAIGVPFTRLHDCHWPNPDVVDMHVLFPNPGADPERPESYDFRLTDEYLAATHATGAQMVYRLGESIEHTKTKRFVHPPKDPERWAQAALGIIRHYNEGWANGFRYDIRYWEIWNEPENRPAMWTGTDEDYFRLYRISARTIKACYPQLKVGGPAVGFSGQIVDGKLQPSAFVTAFLELCRREKLPLDFFSWHCYTADPTELAVRAREVRGLLDSYGFEKTENHLNEWNYLPGGTWDPISRTAAPRDRERYYEQMAGAPGAAFITTALLELQDAPVDVSNLFHGELGGFGLFTEHGVPQKNYHALLAFRKLLAGGGRVKAQGTAPGRLAAAGTLMPDRQSAAVLVSNFNHPGAEVRLQLPNLPWRGKSVYDLQVVDETHDLSPVRRDAEVPEDGTLVLPLRAPAVGLVLLRPAKG